MELKQQFYLEYVEDEAQAELGQLEHKGDICEYVKTFTKLVLQISSLYEREALF